LEVHQTNMEPTFIERVTRITEENLTNEQFSVEELANAMGMSYASLYRQVKGNTHKTISQFVREIRLKKANEILLQEDITASEVAYRVGFGSPTYFSKCFHNYFGYAPGEFRKRNLRNKRKRSLKLFRMNKKQRNIVIVLALIFIAALSILLARNNRSPQWQESPTQNKPGFAIDLSVT